MCLGSCCIAMHSLARRSMKSGAPLHCPASEDPDAPADMTAALSSLGIGLLQFRFPPVVADARHRRRSILAGAPLTPGSGAADIGVPASNATAALSAAQSIEHGQAIRASSAVASRRLLGASASLWPAATYDPARAVCRTQAGNGWLPTLTVAHIPGLVTTLKVKQTPHACICIRPDVDGGQQLRYHSFWIDWICHLAVGLASLERPGQPTCRQRGLCSFAPPGLC